MGVLVTTRKDYIMIATKDRPEFEAVYQAIAAAMRPYEQKLSPLEMLAVLSNMVGKLVALQDQRKVTPDLAMEVVARNLEIGNMQAMEELLKNTEGRA